VDHRDEVMNSMTNTSFAFLSVTWVTVGVQYC